MKELLDILAASKDCQSPMALATIVQTSGSSYRHAGARMLVLPDGRTVGCISGGCLDQDVVDRAMRVMRDGKAALMTYDTSSDRDLVFGSGVGCNGIVELLLECLPPRIGGEQDDGHFLDFLEGALQRRNTGAAATVVGTSGDVCLTLGDRVAVDESGRRATNLNDGPFADLLAAVAESALATEPSGIGDLEFPGGKVRVFAETFRPQRNLIILGAGHDAMPLARLAHELGIRVTVIDARPDYVTSARFPLAQNVIVARPGEEEIVPIFDYRTAAVIMTHNYMIDQGWLKMLLPLRLPYLGLMGPRKRAERMLAELRQDGFELREEHLPSLHNPIGLDIGAETPEQIALAILAEVQAVSTGRDGGKLRQKKGAIRAALGDSSFHSFIRGLTSEARSCALPA